MASILMYYQGKWNVRRGAVLFSIISLVSDGTWEDAKYGVNEKTPGGEDLRKNARPFREANRTDLMERSGAIPVIDILI